jgi:F5/8 type C domain-containing protein
MKRCPKCKRTYDDDTLRFCLEDGTPLFDARDSEAPATAILPGRGSPTLKSTGPTVPSYAPIGEPHAHELEKRGSNPLLTAGVIAIAVLLLALVGIAGFFVMRQGADEAKVNPSATPSTKGATPDNPKDDSEANRTSTPAQPNTPLKITGSASSIRLAVQANTYYASNAIDGKRTTAWIEGADGAGVGEWIRFDFDREIVLHRILWQPGYFKSPQIWAENNRLASVTAYFSDGSSRELTFTDQMESQKVDVGSVRTRWVRFVIKSVYYGSDPDTAVSEVAFEWDQ